MQSFRDATQDEFATTTDIMTTNIPQTGRLTVHIFDDPLFKADGRVTFNRDPGPALGPVHHR